MQYIIPLFEKTVKKIMECGTVWEIWPILTGILENISKKHWIHPHTHEI